MKNLKRILSLVLVIALAFSLVTVAGAKKVSDYTDGASIQYDEAVDVLTNLGVLQGYGASYFGAALDLTREQAAKIICYILVGSTVADQLTTTTSSFTDVAPTRWSAPYIEYCVDQGIINGYGDGTFGPTDPVTALQMVKMLLIAIGYGAEGEFDSSSWEVNTLILGQQNGILTTGVDYSDPATREEVAEYTFRALIAPLVTYSALLGDYIHGTIQGILDDILHYTSITEAQKGYEYTTLGWETFTLHSHYGEQDAYGYDGHSWYIMGDDDDYDDEQIYVGASGYYSGCISVSSWYMDDVILGTLYDTTTVTQGYMYSNYQWDSDVDFYENGDYTGYDYSTCIAVSGSTVLAFDCMGYVLDGAKFTLVDEDGNGKVDKVIITYAWLCEVTKVVAATATTDRYLEVTVYDGGPSSTEIPVYTDSYALGDMLLVTPDGIGGALACTYPIAIEKATTTTGKITGYDYANMTATIDGVKYDVSDFLHLEPFPISFTASYYFYWDAYGNVIGIREVPATQSSLTYMYVYNSALTTKYVAATDFTDAVKGVLKVAATLTDGTSKVYTLKTNTLGSEASIGGTTYDLTDDTDVVADGWYSYIVNTDGTVSLATLNASKAVAAATSLSVTKASAIVTLNGTAMTQLATSTTTMTVVTNGVATTYTGIANFPTATYAIGAIQAMVKYNTTGQITGIYVLYDTAAAPGTTALLKAVGDYTAAGYEYTFSVAGVDKMYVIDAVLSIGDVYTLTTTSGVTTAVLNDPDVINVTATAVDVSYFVVGGVPIYYAAGVQVYNADTGAATTVTAGSTVSYYLNASGQATLIYVGTYS